MKSVDSLQDDRSIALVVDIDGTLLQTDILYESALQFVAQYPMEAFRLIGWSAQGKATLKRKIAERVDPRVDPAAFLGVGLGDAAVVRNAGGRVSDEVVRQSPGPLVLVGPHCSAIPDNDPHILVCVDGSETSAAVLPVVADWAVALGLDNIAELLHEAELRVEAHRRRHVPQGVLCRLASARGDPGFGVG